MNRLNRTQKSQVQQFQAITGASEKIALDCLRAAGWSVEGGIDVFYSSAASMPSRQAAPSLDRAAIEATFDRYKDDDDPDVILAEGVQQLCEDLGVDPADIVMLVLSYHLDAATMCEYSRQEWVSGLTKLRCDSLDKLKSKLPELRRQLDDPALFKEIYNYAYNFCREKGQKCVQQDTALGMWDLLLRDRWPLLDQWLDFLGEHHKHAISRDTWTQLWDFIQSVKSDLSDYDENGAWPYLLDEFVEHIRAAQEQAS